MSIIPFSHPNRHGFLLCSFNISIKLGDSANLPPIISYTFQFYIRGCFPLYSSKIKDFRCPYTQSPYLTLSSLYYCACCLQGYVRETSQALFHKNLNHKYLIYERKLLSGYLWVPLNKWLKYYTSMSESKYAISSQGKKPI